MFRQKLRKHFNFERFHTIDHFLLSIDVCVRQACVLHDCDNLSDHDPIVLQLSLNTNHLAMCDRVHVSRASWEKASDTHIVNYPVSYTHLTLPTNREV